MLDLVTADRPDVVCLQEVPGWALGRLGGWTGMTELDALAKRPTVGLFRVPAVVGRALTAPHHGRIRSAFTGQGNAILLARGLAVRVHDTRSFAYGHLDEARAAQRATLDGLTVANVHCSHDERGAEELGAVLAWLGAADPLVLAGDFNTPPERAPALAAFAGALPGSIDQVLARGAAAVARVWPDDERRYGGRLLSDHAPVEAVVSF
jgi:endonuclease/exonuclease/phosphatase family metal-dependent hydrolase